MTAPDFRVDLRWQRQTGQPIVGVRRVGAWLQIGDGWRRVPEALFDIAESVDKLNAVAPGDLGARYATVAALREVLPGAAARGSADAKGLIGAMTIAIADAFSLDLRGDGDSAKLTLILHRAGGDPEQNLLPPEQQDTFGAKQFHMYANVRPVYALGQNNYVVLQPDVRRALTEVRRVNSASLSTKRAFMANPRAFIAEALGEEAAANVVEFVFRETAAYSKRVVGLGLWTKRVLPWITQAATDWFGKDGEELSAAPQKSKGGIELDGRLIALTPSEADEASRKIETAGRG